MNSLKGGGLALRFITMEFIRQPLKSCEDCLWIIVLFIHSDIF
nr:MAG TPA: Heat stable enterotoxin [Bacteriophage sp.]